MLVSEVLDVYPIDRKTWRVVLDAGVCTLPSMDCWSGHVELLDSEHGAEEAVDLVGPSCMEEDRIARVLLRVPRVGQRVIFYDVGGYHWAGGTAFAETRPTLYWISADGQSKILAGVDAPWR
jgi:diaminopimelate decarboxylase